MSGVRTYSLKVAELKDIRKKCQQVLEKEKIE
jgi:hypothetical protein